MKLFQAIGNMNMNLKLKKSFAKLIVIAMAIYCALKHPVSEAANKNVWLEQPMNTITNAQSVTNCIGDIVGFRAVTGWPYGDSWSWSGADRTTPAIEHPSEAQKTYLSDGTFSVTATYNGETANAIIVKVAKINSLTVTGNGGIYSFDDGDANSDTELRLVHWGMGSVIVEATPSMSIPNEESFPPC